MWNKGTIFVKEKIAYMRLGQIFATRFSETFVFAKIIRKYLYSRNFCEYMRGNLKKFSIFWKNQILLKIFVANEWGDECENFREN